MNETRDLKKIKEELTQRKWELEEKLTSLSKEQLSDGQVQDPGDQALTSIMESLRLFLQDAEVDEYRRIVSALRKIDEGVYGLCGDCGNPISEKRLQLFPDTTRCLACQEAFETQSGQDHNFTI